ncbi:O-antigen ligase family protein [Paracoccus sediminicola]|uniref:O-antigen ligase family protein n=1 Tax=Paracoccus sediminicola TaxID=3017783 RepID=UPI0022F0C8FB|nr:O-antigen ligase family protein [Paracoccus sediminicola]WBU56506.1 O-antigen ligase family protein [Paracoccus sediminicola]
MRRLALATGASDAITAPKESFWRADLILVGITVFLSPMNYFRADFAYITLGDIFALLTCSIMFMRGLLPLHPLGRATAGWLISVLMLASGLLLGSAMNGDLLTGIIVVGQYCFSLILLPLIVMQRSRDEVVLLVKIFVLSMVVVMVHGAWAVSYTPEDLRFVSRNGRLAGLVERENATAALAAVAITFTLWLYFISELRSWLLPLIMVPLVWGLLLTGSNSGFLLTAIGISFLTLFSGALRVWIGMTIGTALFMFAIYQWGELFLPEVFMERVFGALESGDVSEAGTFEDRLELMREAFSLTRNTIFLGLGADQYRTVSIFGAPVHNVYLLLLAEGGLISLLGHLGLQVTSVFIAWPVWLSRGTRWFGVLTITATIMLAFSQMGITHYYARFWVMPWLLAIAASVAVMREEEESA